MEAGGFSLFSKTITIISFKNDIYVENFMNFFKLPNIKSIHGLMLRRFELLMSAKLFDEVIERLENLSISFCNYHYTLNPFEFGASSSAIFPNLKTLKMTTESKTRLNFVGIEFPVLEKLSLVGSFTEFTIDSYSFKKIKSIELDTNDGTNVFQQLVKNSNLKFIEHVKLSKINFNTFIRNGHKYKHLKTLKIGEFTEISNIDELAGHKIILKSLECLEIQDCGNLDLLKLFKIPNIKKMELLRATTHYDNEFCFHHQYYPKLEDLMIQMSYHSSHPPFKIELPTLKTLYINKKFLNDFRHLNEVNMWDLSGKFDRYGRRLTV
ncbi:hypothetical protein BN7_1351 [Wickerhamomyces ciferrii]|uniref:Uncharacterized protein n=1 Tax=Wickerhamomyces ciferrii (strain ATCC 14091 / BCRC 22168 / CBS 111 / JCM 3599 / NBRC 0793 / NRRL Y-1031 F-60-10) TaxID=1206466 RepID=K0KI30_WICCF|nr:uncharacterized protein BN7_1351 [Wickerhamomyces ciferrii]CCH41812.1 hypothetical protein BN7_1351 [Wickerhamomyces ciferrii]